MIAIYLALRDRDRNIVAPKEAAAYAFHCPRQTALILTQSEHTAACARQECEDVGVAGS